MTDPSVETTVEDDRVLVITRLFDAPRERVWHAWTDPARIAAWWGPEGFTTRVESLDLRPGGRWHYVMTGPDGTDYPVNGVYREVVVPELLVTSDDFGDGYTAESPNDLPTGMIVTVRFDPVEGGKTRLTLRIEHRSVEEMAKHEAMGVVAGWESTFRELDRFLAA